MATSNFKKKLNKLFPLLNANPNPSAKAKEDFNRQYNKAKLKQKKAGIKPQKYSNVEKKGYTKPKAWKGEGRQDQRIKAMSGSKVGRTYMGTVHGSARALGINPQEEKIPQKARDSFGYKAGKLGGEMLVYALPSGALEHTAGKVATKAIASKTGKKAVKKLAKSNTFKKAMAKSGKPIIKSSENFLKGVVKEGVRDIPTGMIIGHNQMMADGVKPFSEEYNKNMALNTALDVGIGGAVELTPMAYRAMKNKNLIRKSLKNVHEVPTGTKVSSDNLSNLRTSAVKTKLKNGDEIMREPEISNLERLKAGYIREQNARGNAYDHQLNTLKENDPVLAYKKRVADKSEVYDANRPKPIELPDEPEKSAFRNFEESRLSSGKATINELADQNKRNLAVRSDLPPKKAHQIEEPPVTVEESTVKAEKSMPKVEEPVVDAPIETPVIEKDGTVRISAEEYNRLTGHKNTRANAIPENIDTSLGHNDPRIQENIDKYGAFDDAPHVAVANDKGQVSQAAKTLINSDVFPQEHQEFLNVLSAEGTFNKETISNKELFGEAIARLDNTGDIDKSVKEIDGIMDSEISDFDKNIAFIQQALIRASELDRTDLMDKLASDLVELMSQSGRALQSQKLFLSQTPVGRRMTAEKTINRMVKKFGYDIEMPNDLLELLMKETDPEQIARLNHDISLNVWNQIPPTISDKLTSWRYLSMLGNPKTHIRNLIGNMLMLPLRATRDVIATGIEKAVIKDGLKSKAFLTKADQPLRDLATESYEVIKHHVKGVTKFNDFARPQEAKIFNTKLLESLRHKNTSGLEWVDEKFFEHTYKSAYAKFLKANGFDVANPDAKLLQLAENYAKNEGLVATYRNENALADFITKSKKNANLPLKNIAGKNKQEKMVKKVAAMLVDSILPFAKTPTNVLARSVDYAGVGYLKALYKLTKAKGNPEKLIEGISDLATGMTGTGIFGVGLALAHLGIANGSIDTSKPMGQFIKEKGGQSYALNIATPDGDVYTYSIDWATPACIPFFIGVEASRGLEDFSLDVILDSFGQMTDPVFSLSMLSGVQQAFDTQFGTGNSVVDIGNNIVQGRLSQYIPTIAGQFARTLTKESKTTTSTSEGKIAKEYEMWFRSMLNKVPALNNLTEPYVNTYGETDRKESGKDYAMAVFNNFLNPGTIKKVKLSDNDKELIDLSSQMSEEEFASVLPKKTSTYDVKSGENSYRMNEKELTQYKKTRGENTKSSLNELFNSDGYEDMSIEDKKKAIAEVYSKSKKSADKEMLIGRGMEEYEVDFNNLSKSIRDRYDDSMDKKAFVNTYKGMSGYNTNVAKHLGAINNGASFENVAMIDDGAKRDTYGKAMVLHNLGITPETVDKYSKTADFNGNGRRSVDEVVTFLNGQNLSMEQKRVLFDVLVRSKKNPY